MKFLNKLFEKLLVLDIFLMFAILLLQIFSRFIIFIPMSWSQDLIQFFLVLMVFLGSVVAVNRDKHIAIDLLDTYLPNKLATKIKVFCKLIAIAFLMIITYEAFMLSNLTEGQKMGSSPIPTNVYYLVIAFGCLFMMVNYIFFITRLSKEKKIGGENN